MPDFQLLNVLNGNLSFATRKTIELEMLFFSWQQSPWRLWGWKGAALFSLCAATVDSPGLSQQSPGLEPGDGSWLCHWDKGDPTGGETLEHCVSPSGAGAALYMWGKWWGENSHCAAHTLSLQFPSTHRQPAGKGWWQLCSSPLLCHQGWFHHLLCW